MSSDGGAQRVCEPERCAADSGTSCGGRRGRGGGGTLERISGSGASPGSWSWCFPPMELISLWAGQTKAPPPINPASDPPHFRGREKTGSRTQLPLHCLNLALADRPARVRSPGDVCQEARRAWPLWVRSGWPLDLWGGAWSRFLDPTSQGQAS